MTDYRSEAEKFVTEFLDYMSRYDILDEFDKSAQKMVRSAGVNALYTKAQSIFPPRVPIGKVETDKLSEEVLEQLVTESPNVIDRRDVFSRKISDAGSARGLLAGVLEGNPDAVILAQEFLKAERGEKEFDTT